MNKCNRIIVDKCWGKTIPFEPKFEGGKKRSLWVHVYCFGAKFKRENTVFYDGFEAFEKQRNIGHLEKRRDRRRLYAFEEPLDEVLQTRQRGS